MQFRTPSAVLPTALLAALSIVGAASAQSSADSGAPARETRWTGPLVTPAPPLREGTSFIEPYLVYTETTGAYDRDGRRRDVDGAKDDWRVIVPFGHGITDRLTVGGTVRAVYAPLRDGGRRLAVGDSTVSMQYSLFRSEGAAPSSLAVGLRQNVPTGRHDQLDRHGLADATGSGAAFTSLALYGQRYWLPEHTLRTRFNVLYRIGGAGVNIDGRSGLGTPGDFRGRAHLGEAWQASIGAEYSLSPKWVLAADVLYEREQGTRLHTVTEGFDGAVSRTDIRRDGSWRVSVAPAVEYHFTPNTGLIVGALVSLDGRNSAEIFQPQAALNVGF